MKKPSEPAENWDSKRNKIIGLGERSLRKSYYPELQRQLEATRQSEERFRLLAENTQDGVLIVEKSVVKYANSRLVDILGESELDLSETSTVSDLIAQIDTHSPDYGKPTVTELWITRPNNSKRYLHIRHFRLPLDENTNRLYIMVTDMTAPKLREEDLERLVRERTAELQKAYEKLKELDQLKDNFVSNVSHELRTPLTNIQLYSQLLELNRNPGKQTRYWQILKAEVARLGTLIEDLLILSRLEHGRFPQKRERTNIHHLIAQELKVFQARIKNKNLSIRHLFPPDLPSLFIDPHQGRQLIANLLANAVAYTPADGKVHISYTAVSLHNTPAICIKIHNDGPPIPAADLPNIFERFYRGKNARATQAHGTGLGLAICKQIVEQYDGVITIDSSENIGTIVAVYLPVLTETS